MIKVKIKIIYFCYLIPDDWSVLNEQITDLKKSGLYDIATELYINCVIQKEKENKFRDIITKNASKFIIKNISYENTYEYVGIKCLYDTAEPNSFSFYFHTKGISNKSIENDMYRRFLFNKLSKYKNIIPIFMKDKYMEKVSCFPSNEGWCWYNFFWASGEFLLSKDPPVEIPNRKDHRWYYEMWSMGKPSKSYSIITKNKLFTSHEANFYMHKLFEKK